MKVQVEDRTKVEEVLFKYSFLFNDKAEDTIKVLYDDLMETEHQLDVERQKVRDLEKEVKEKKILFNELQDLITLKFATKEVETVDRERVNMTVVNPTDASNRNYTG